MTECIALNQNHLLYADSDSLVLDVVTLKRVPSIEPTIKCPFCGSLTKLSSSGLLCPICQLSELGARTLGLQFRTII